MCNMFSLACNRREKVGCKREGCLLCKTWQRRKESQVKWGNLECNRMQQNGGRPRANFSTQTFGSSSQPEFPKPSQTHCYYFPSHCIVMTTRPLSPTALKSSSRCGTIALSYLPYLPPSLSFSLIPPPL